MTVLSSFAGRAESVSDVLLLNSKSPYEFVSLSITESDSLRATCRMGHSDQVI